MRTRDCAPEAYAFGTMKYFNITDKICLLELIFACRKTAFLGVCTGSLVAVGAGIAYLVRH